MKPGELYLDQFPFGDTAGMKLRPVLVLEPAPDRLPGEFQREFEPLKDALLDATLATTASPASPRSSMIDTRRDTMTTLTLQMPDEVLAVLREEPERFGAELRLAAAMN